ncbi:outer membrane protein assembly factor BamB family protein [Actinoplanes regularis]|nr:PQQ-binding-like beta-propeller repeat protein [Actinoplanes regularis]
MLFLLLGGCAAASPAARGVPVPSAVPLPSVPSVRAVPVPMGWDRPGFDPGNTFFNPGETVLTAGSIGRLVKKWSVRLRVDKQSCPGQIDVGPPVVSGDHVVIGDHKGISVYAARTGLRLWAFQWDDFGEGLRPTLTITNRLVIAGYAECYSVSNSKSRLIAFDPTTGKPRWAQDGTPSVAYVVVDKGVAMASGWEDPSSVGLAAYSLANGEQIWSKPGHIATGVSAGGTVLAHEINVNEEVPETVTGVDITTGATRWTAKGTWYAEAASPAGDRLYASDEKGELAAFRVADGTVAWTAPPGPGDHGEWTMGSMSIATDGVRVYRSSDRTLEALDAPTGRLLWTYRMKTSSPQPVVAGGLVYVDGVALHADRGKVAYFGPALTGAVVVTGGRLFQVNGDTLSVYAPAQRPDRPPALSPRP